jgi:hypothetical protein
MPGLDVAKEIHKTSPNQRIVITTTGLREHISKEQLDSGGIDHEDIMTIPFRFSQMRPLLDPNSKNSKP